MEEGDFLLRAAWKEKKKQEPDELLSLQRANSSAIRCLRHSTAVQPSEVGGGGGVYSIWGTAAATAPSHPTIHPSIRPSVGPIGLPTRQQTGTSRPETGSTAAVPTEGHGEGLRVRIKQQRCLFSSGQGEGKRKKKTKQKKHAACVP